MNKQITRTFITYHYTVKEVITTLNEGVEQVSLAPLETLSLEDKKPLEKIQKTLMKKYPGKTLIVQETATTEELRSMSVQDFIAHSVIVPTAVASDSNQTTL